MTRARTDIQSIDDDLTAALKLIRETMQPADGSAEETALCAVEVFCVLALRIMAKTNPSKVRSESRTLEIKCRMDGIPFIGE